MFIPYVNSVFNYFSWLITVTKASPNSLEISVLFEAAFFSILCVCNTVMRGCRIENLSADMGFVFVNKERKKRVQENRTLFYT